ncbi:DMT family transporter [Rummeliibacillus suwonensis]|jgi:drug/metabolite transporter (DMT)-like permease|uniref:DMT family transporter n=1 Tax=Rummeliibacillus suwonensis TaxID=1306154 RepID=UPI001AAE341F|nr:DMT family transporter [Rummeliibacillus suwonensis]MBO2537376.1 DMT family transporter [Rummeliibacillus suwonensis]
MWFLFSILTALAWGGADLFYKKGSDSNDKYSHLKIVVIVGLVMGLHATGYMLYKDIDFKPFDMVKYLPVSFFYIASMTIGYVGLRYLELSISSPVQNSSGAITAILLFIFFQQDIDWIHILGVIIITSGVMGIAIVEKQEEHKTMRLNRVEVDKKYQLSFMAITFPIIYALLDGAGTFADGIYLDELKLMSEDVALLAYEYTFFICAVITFIYLKAFKKIPFNVFKERDKTCAAILETTGQFFYVYAMSAYAIIAAPLIASYSIFSVILSRIFLKEKLTAKHYMVIAIVMIGIILLGVADEL